MRSSTSLSAQRIPTDVQPGTVVVALSAIFLLNLLLRVFYLRFDFVNGDEGVRALTAVRLLEGARLYLDVVTDKPPGSSFFYASIFAVFGRSMKAVHLAAIIWNFTTAVVIYLIGARFHSRRSSLWAVFLFVYFSTNYLTQDMMAANTELLMALPYTAALFFFLESVDPGSDAEQRENEIGHPPSKFRFVATSLSAGFLTGVATTFKQVGIFNLLLFFIWSCVEIYRATPDGVDAARWKVVRREA